MLWFIALAFIVYTHWGSDGYWQASYYFALLISYSLIVAIIRVKRGDGLYRYPGAELPYEKLFRYTFTVCFSLMFVTYALSRDVWGYQVDSYTTLVYVWRAIVIVFILNLIVIIVNKTHVEETNAYNAHRIKLCTKFLYRYIRHPTYALMIIQFMLLPVLMGNHFGYAYSIIISSLYVYRTKKEDEYLIDFAPGYREYSKITKYRLIYGVW